jgi:hypothetical protein
MRIFISYAAAGTFLTDTIAYKSIGTGQVNIDNVSLRNGI